MHVNSQPSLLPLTFTSTEAVQTNLDQNYKPWCKVVNNGIFLIEVYRKVQLSKTMWSQENHTSVHESDVHCIANNLP